MNAAFQFRFNWSEAKTKINKNERTIPPIMVSNEKPAINEFIQLIKIVFFNSFLRKKLIGTSRNFINSS